MKDLKVTETGDIDIFSNDLSLVSDSLELNQTIRLILSTRIGEFQLDEEIGLNWDNLLGKDYNPDYLMVDINNALSDQEPRIEQIVSIDFRIEGRKLFINMRMIGVTEEEIVEEVALDVG